MEKSERISESIRLGTILSLTGGFMDAYSYLVRGGVFANAVTGNIVQTGINLADGNFSRAVYCFIPVLSFAAGVFVAEYIREKYGDRGKIHWKEVILWAEVILVFLAGFIPQELNSIVNFSIAFICAMQVEAFRKIRGKAFATTMCTGNLRSGTELLSLGIFKGDKEKKQQAMHYYWIDLVFCGGAVVGFFVCHMFAERAIWFCLITLVVAILFIMKQKKKTEV